MELSVFEIIGPPMVGPSSSHTAGACRIGWAARHLLAEPPVAARFSLHGSFLATGEGHGTREALAAGLLAFAPDDERLKGALAAARDSGVEIRFDSTDLGPQAHPNSVQVELASAWQRLSLTASSVGGGSLVITEIDGHSTAIRGTLETLVLWHRDTAGMLARVTAVLACVETNVASIQTSRLRRGETAITTIEMDGSLCPEAVALLRRSPHVSRAVLLPVLPGF